MIDDIRLSFIDFSRLTGIEDYECRKLVANGILKTEEKTFGIENVRRYLDYKISNPSITIADLCELTGKTKKEITAIDRAGGLAKKDGKFNYLLVDSVKKLIDYAEKVKNDAVYSSEYGSVGVIAVVLAVSPHAVNRLEESGVLVKNDKGDFNIKQSVRAYLEHLRTTSNEDGLSLDDQRKQAAIRRDNSLADKNEMENDVRRRNLIEADEITDFINELAIAIKLGLLQSLGRNEQHKVNAVLESVIAKIKEFETRAFD